LRIYPQYPPPRCAFYARLGFAQKITVDSAALIVLVPDKTVIDKKTKKNFCPHTVALATRGGQKVCKIPLGNSLGKFAAL
jgi:hypothetical protein